MSSSFLASMLPCCVRSSSNVTSADGSGLILASWNAGAPSLYRETTIVDHVLRASAECHNTVHLPQKFLICAIGVPQMSRMVPRGAGSLPVGPVHGGVL